MESSRNPAPEPGSGTASPPPPPPHDERSDGKAGGGWRALGLVLGVALLLAGAVMIAVMVDIGGTPLQDECDRDPTCTEYYGGSSGAKTVSLILGWPGGVIAVVAGLVGLYFAATGRRGRLLLQLTAAAIVLCGLSIAIG